MKTEAIIAILISIIVFLTCLSIHYSALKTEAEVEKARLETLNDEMWQELKDKTLEMNRLKVINTSLKKEIAEWQEIKGVKLTAYCPCEECSEEWGTQTKSGKEATEGRTVAVDTNYIELGSQVKINGKTYIAEDVGGGVEGLHIDIYMDNHDEATEFGVQTADVKVKKGKGKK
jgi:3D (Asp-Asp-Asp) domain-containing protein